MTDGKEKARKWKDREGTRWFVRRREGAYGLEDGWILTRVGYSMVAYAESPELPSVEQLQAWIDEHTAQRSLRDDGPRTTVRLWTDGRDHTEWEVFREGGDLVFQRGIEAVRTEAPDWNTRPRSMSDDELKQALDRAQGAEEA